MFQQNAAWGCMPQYPQQMMPQMPTAPMPMQMPVVQMPAMQAPAPVQMQPQQTQQVIRGHLWVSPDGKTVKLGDANVSKLLVKLDLVNSVRTMLSPDGKHVVSQTIWQATARLGSSGKIAVYDLADTGISYQPRQKTAAVPLGIAMPGQPVPAAVPESEAEEAEDDGTVPAVAPAM